MKVKDLKEALANIRDDADVLLAIEMPDGDHFMHRHEVASAEIQFDAAARFATIRAKLGRQTHDLDGYIPPASDP